MKFPKIIYSSLFILLSCTNGEHNESKPIIKETIEPLEVSGTTIDMELLTYKRETSTWALNDIPFTTSGLYPSACDKLKKLIIPLSCTSLLNQTSFLRFWFTSR